MPGIPPWIRNTRGGWFLNMGLLFGRDIHWFASFSLNKVLRALERFRSGARVESVRLASTGLCGFSSARNTVRLKCLPTVIWHRGSSSPICRRYRETLRWPLHSVACGWQSQSGPATLGNSEPKSRRVVVGGATAEFSLSWVRRPPTVAGACPIRASFPTAEEFLDLLAAHLVEVVRYGDLSRHEP